MGFNNTLSKSAVKSSESSRYAPDQIATTEHHHQEGMPSEPNKNGHLQGEMRRAARTRDEMVRVQGPGTSRLNPAIAEFKPTATRNLAAPLELSLQRTFNPNASIPVFGSSNGFNSNLAVSALESPNVPSSTNPTEIIPQHNHAFADQNFALNPSPKEPQQSQASYFFQSTDIVSRAQHTFDDNKNDINTHMSANFQNQVAQRQPASQANLQQMQPAAHFASQASLQHPFPTQPVPPFHANAVQQPLNDTNFGNSTAVNNSVRGDIMQQQGNYVSQPMHMGMANHGDGTTFCTSISHGNVQQQVQYGPQPMLMGMGQHGQTQSLPSVPASHAQAAMNALQAHLSRVEAEQGANVQLNQVGGYGFQTPVRKGTANSSTPRMTPSSYRLTPSSGLASANPLSPNNAQVVRMSARTEPRNFAPRNNGYFTDEQPPRFAIEAPMPMHHTNVQGISAAPQQYGSSHGASALLQRQQDPEVGSGTSSSGDGGDPFSSAPMAIEKYRGSITDLIQPTQNFLSHIIKPIEPLSTALAMQSHPVPEYIRRQRSKHLNELTATPTARPTAEAALHVDNFPFIEGARCAQPSQNHGVLKVKNVSRHPLYPPASSVRPKLTSDPNRSRLLWRVLRSSLSLAVTPRF